MKKNILYAILILPMLWSLASCADDKDEPKDPNKKTPTELPTIEKDGAYVLSYPVKCTLLNTNKENKLEFKWINDGENMHDRNDFPFGYLAGAWGGNDCEVMVTRTDGKPLNFVNILCYHSKEVWRPLYAEPYEIMWDYWQYDMTSKDLDLKVGEKYDQGTYSIEKIDDFSYKIVVKAINKDTDWERTRYVRAITDASFAPTKITSVDGKTEYQLTQDIIDVTPSVCMIAPGSFTTGPMNNVAEKRNVLMRELTGGKILESKK